MRRKFSTKTCENVYLKKAKIVALARTLIADHLSIYVSIIIRFNLARTGVSSGHFIDR